MKFVRRPKISNIDESVIGMSQDIPENTEVCRDLDGKCKKILEDSRNLLKVFNAFN